MDKKKRKVRLSQIINVFLILNAISDNLYAFSQGEALLTDLISMIITIISLICAMVYTVRGYKQEDYRIFNAFVILIIITILLQLGGEIYYLIIIGPSILKQSIITIFSLILDITLLLIIVIVKDIDRKAALTFAGIITVFSIFNFVRMIATYADFPSYIALTFSAIVLSLILYISVAERYKYNISIKKDDDEWHTQKKKLINQDNLK